MNKNNFVLIIALVCFTASSFSHTTEEVRGVWVPDPQYTDVLKSYNNVQQFVAMLDSLNFNSIFVVSYALNKIGRAHV